MDQPEPDPSAPTTPNPDGRLSDTDLLNMGVDPSARGFVEALLVIGIGFLMACAWTWNRGRRLLSGFVAWNRADKRNVGITALSVALLIVGFIAYDGHDSKAPQPPQPETATKAPANTGGMRKHKIADRETLVSIGAQNGVSRDEMIAANLTLIRENTAWCKARPVSGDYLKGILKGTTAKRDSNFCVMFDYNGEELALDTAKVGQIANVPVPAVATNEN